MFSKITSTNPDGALEPDCLDSSPISVIYLVICVIIYSSIKKVIIIPATWKAKEGG
jgi:hypothetical protein